jgi:transcriptional regulator with XRE-family HTH domain
MEKQTSMGARIKKLREHYDLSQGKFAEIVKSTVNTISNIERENTNTLQQETLNIIAKKFGTTVEWLRTGKGSMLLKGKIDIESISNDETSNPWKDVAFANLKAEAETWKEKYNDLYNLFNNTVAAFRVGKLNAVSSTGLGNFNMFNEFKTSTQRKRHN